MYYKRNRPQNLQRICFPVPGLENPLFRKRRSTRHSISATKSQLGDLGGLFSNCRRCETLAIWPFLISRINPVLINQTAKPLTNHTAWPELALPYVGLIVEERFAFWSINYSPSEWRTFVPVYAGQLFLHLLTSGALTPSWHPKMNGITCLEEERQFVEAGLEIASNH